MHEDVDAEVAMVAAAAVGSACSGTAGSDAIGWLAWVRLAAGCGVTVL
jgi:hypothetical protein